jgi:16S rRNA processing protein RimM
MPPHLARTGRSSSRSSKRSEPAALAADTIAVGQIVAAHALKGFVRVRPYQAPAPSLHAGAIVALEQDGLRREVRLSSVDPHGRGLLLVSLDGVTGREAAEQLVGSRILVRAADLPPAAEDEFYYHELAGFRVETTAGEPLGTIAETFSTGLNDVWVVRDEAREHLIPVIADVVRAIDRPARRVVVEPMPGLFD